LERGERRSGGESGRVGMRRGDFGSEGSEWKLGLGWKEGVMRAVNGWGE